MLGAGEIKRNFLPAKLLRVPRGEQDVETEASSDHSRMHSAAYHASHPGAYETVDAKDLDRFTRASKTRSEHGIGKAAERYLETEVAGRQEKRAASDKTPSSTWETAKNHVKTAAANTSATEVDAASVASRDSINQELLDFQLKEAKSCIGSSDWQGAEENIVGLLESTFLTPEIRQKWTLKRAEVMGVQKKWMDVVEILDSLESGDAEHLRAEAYFELGQFEKAKIPCLKAIRVKNEDPESIQSLNDATELMGKILDALGKNVEARFYRSKIPKEYIPTDLSGRLQAKVKSAEKKLLEKWGSGASVESEERVTPLHLAAKYDRADYIPILLQRGAALEAVAKIGTGREGATPLHYASLRGSADAAEALLKLGANIRSFDSKNETPLYYAIDSDSLKTIKLLISMGANLDSRTVVGWTPLHHAARVGSEKAVRYLLDNGADLTARATTVDLVAYAPYSAALKNATALHQAIMSQSLPKVELLLLKGASVNEHDENRWTPLHYAARFGTKQITEYLLNKGADIAAESNWPLSFPLTLTIYHSDSGTARLIAKVLLERTGNKDFKERSLRSALDREKENKNKVMRKFLKAEFILFLNSNYNYISSRRFGNWRRVNRQY